MLRMKCGVKLRDRATGMEIAERMGCRVDGRVVKETMFNVA